MAPATNSDALLAGARDIERRDAEILLAAAWNLSRGALLARAGEPVPTSSSLSAPGCAAGGSPASTRSTSSSVSGRGTSTAGETASFRPMKSCVPST
jgi:hypothetical protein